jgi:hypothetical protein
MLVAWERRLPVGTPVELWGAGPPQVLGWQLLGQGGTGRPAGVLHVLRHQPPAAADVAGTLQTQAQWVMPLWRALLQQC